MAQVTRTTDHEVRRMELRGIVRLAGEIIGQYWPMRTFVHHNPLHSLEYLRFHEAVGRGRQLLGGQGYLSCEVYRGYLRSGRIRRRHLDEALAPITHDKHVVLNGRRIAHGDVLRACLTEGLCTPLRELLDAAPEGAEDRQWVVPLAEHLAPARKPVEVEEQMRRRIAADQAALGRNLMLAHWCDRILGTQIVQQINTEMIKWCEAFLDEGHATWPMPGRDRDFYGAWKFLAVREWSPCGIEDSGQKIAALPAHPEDALLESLEALAIPSELWQDYLALHLAALPGWAGFIKWRAEAREYAWQQTHPVSLVKYLAVRLWYERVLVQKACHEELGIGGGYGDLLAYMQSHPHAYFLGTERVAGDLPAGYADQVDRLRRSHRPVEGDPWRGLTERYQGECGRWHDQAARRAAARRLLALVRPLDLVPAVLLDASPEDLMSLVRWSEAFPEAEHGPVWLNAFEAGYRERLLESLIANRRPTAASSAPPKDSIVQEETAGASANVRPHSQSVFCIDVRSEPLRRHLEAVGANETYGFAGFFVVFIRYRAWDSQHETEQFPVIMRARNAVREVPRTYHNQVLSKHRSRARLIQAGHTLLHDLKENVVTPYVMVESLGWFYSLPIVGKTVFPALYRRCVAWLSRLLVPPMATSLTVDKLTPTDVEEMLVSEQRALVRSALREQLDLHGPRVAPDLIETLRRCALNEHDAPASVVDEIGRQTGMSRERLGGFIEILRKDYRIDRRWAAAQKERLTRTGFTLEEQVVTVGTALQMMGLTRGFARLVLFCAHGSTSDNNPFESALDCGACGGNDGKPNARVIAAMANKVQVREQLARTGIDIPSDTHFLAGRVDTTTEDVHLFDLEDVPATHRKDVARLLEDLKEAGRFTSQERCARLPDVRAALPLRRAASHVRRRSVDWSQVRPEWGLSGNAAFIIGRRELTKGLNLEGRVFLHSYDYRVDATDRLLEVLMTAPQVVAQWINMEHYFSTVDNDVYGSGSKVYHNVVGRFGIMSGPWSDLRLGLAWQTVMNGEAPYHEPMRLLTIVEAPRARLERLVGRHQVLQHFYHNEWVQLVALEPEGGLLFQYLSSGAWRQVSGSKPLDSGV
jgi:uncharacterized protein YbcC (UPF0753/DUF2309 family)